MRGVATHYLDHFCSKAKGAGLYIYFFGARGGQPAGDTTPAYTDLGIVRWRRVRQSSALSCFRVFLVFLFRFCVEGAGVFHAVEKSRPRGIKLFHTLMRRHVKRSVLTDTALASSLGRALIRTLVGAAFAPVLGRVR